MSEPLLKNRLDAETRKVLLRAPELSDASRLHRLISDCPPLDLNSAYLYMLLTEHYRQTCVIAEKDGRLVGAATAYSPPDRPDTLFVWQIAVRAEVRGKGLAKAMLRHLLARPHQRRVQFVEATVSPSNAGSRSLFRSLAADLDTSISEETLFPAELFEERDHEEERLIRVGPFSPERKQR